VEPSEQARDEEFGVSLRWPVDPVGEPLELGGLEDAADDEDAAGAPAEDPAPTQYELRPPPLAARAPSPTASVLEELSLRGPDGIPRALAAIAARIDSLTSAITVFRSATSDRLSEYTERVTRSVAATASGLEAYRAAQEQGLAELRSLLAQMNRSVESLAGELAVVQGELREELATIAGEVQALRRRTSIRARPGGTGLPDEQIDALAQAVATRLGGVGPVEEAPPPRRRRSNS
jgi:uncharacterized coiled-coil protein SlyX